MNEYMASDMATEASKTKVDFSKIQFIDRYSATGTPYPDPETMCKGYCEGMGCYPHKTYNGYMFINQPTELEATEQIEWEKLHRKQMWKSLGLHYFFCDGWHFIKCPTCKGSRLDNNISSQA